MHIYLKPEESTRGEKRPSENEQFFAMDGSLRGVVGKCVLRVLGQWCN